MNTFLVILSIFYSFSISDLKQKDKISDNQKITNNKLFENKTYKKSIRTVLIYKKGWEMSFPIIELNSNDEIELSFDDVTSSSKNYSWKFIHCNSDWTKSDLDQIEYSQGFEQGDITDYQFSKNTTIQYINYKFSFPNEEIKFLKSGNYIVKIFEDGDEKNIVLTKRFYINENVSSINANYKKWLPASLNANNQQINIEFSYNHRNLIDRESELELKIFKNNEIEKTTKNIKPSFIQANKIFYSELRELTFPGGNEFRHVDLKNLKLLSDRIDFISFENDTFSVILKPDNNEKDKEYYFFEDLNGKFLIKLENNNESNIMADYSYVNFSLDMPLSLQSGDYYLFGQISDWQIKNDFKLNYDFKEKKYKLKLLLKQGYYNYQYVFITEDEFYRDNLIRFSAEGNFFNTENDYYILLYHKDKIDGYDKLVGFKMINTVKK
ncbi:MAG: DUF5103 domain-containing protein [Bacteroidales bacterium]|nr:DUF5103 domain-containing protein [Bacteroidales bacterium]MBN2756321.1 DUF5103 domain-containing protein [Bacteroidales bacterium]